MHLVLVGTSYRYAPIELRERMGFDAHQGGEIAARLAGEDGEAVALSTCNRVCVYLVHPDMAVARERALAELTALSGETDGDLESLLYTKVDLDAAAHLFRVTAGLDSLVPGESQILGQVRSAFESADDAGSAGPVLHRLFRQALHAGRRVRTETGIGENPASVSSAAVELAARVFDDPAERAILLVGAGKMAELAATELIARGFGRLVVANRSPEKAARLAERHGGESIGLDRLVSELGRADVVITSTGSHKFILTAADVEPVLRERRGRPIFFIDIAVPRDLDPAINDLDGCYVYDIDDLERVVEASIAGRRESTERAERIVGEEAEKFDLWQHSLDVVPAITSLRQRAEAIREQELARSASWLAALSPRERTAVEALTTQIVNKLLHVPTVRLKEAAAAPEGARYAETVRRLFDLGEED